MAVIFTYLLLLLSYLPYSYPKQSSCQQLRYLDRKLYDQLFIATEISLPLSDSRLVVLKPEKIPGTNCTYQINQISYIISGNLCNKIPSNHSVQGFDVAIEYTPITTLLSRSFVTYDNIISLHIRRNPYLNSIEKNAFINLTKLINLTITNNNLRHLEKGCFSGLEKVQQISLIGNKITRINNITPALNRIDLPSLTYIDLRENKIPVVYEDDFIPMKDSTLNALILSSTQTEYIHPKAFDPLTNLVEKIIFTQNKINGTVAAEIVRRFTAINRKLKRLSLAANPLYKDIKTLLDAVTNSPITFLDISNNYFLEMGPGFFPIMPRIQILDISNVMINDLSADVINSTLMPNLTKLYLSKNNLRELSISIPTLTTLDLSYINSNNLAWNVDFTINSEVFRHMPNLKWLSLEGTRLSTVSKDTFSKAKNLEYLSLKEASLVTIEDGSFKNNVKLQYLDLSRNTFPIFQSLSKGLFQGLHSLQALDLSYSHISNFPNSEVFYHLKSLQYISLRMNSLYRISNSFFQKSPCLITVDLRFNTLESWNQRLFSDNKFIEEIILDYNHLTTLTKDMVQDFSAPHLWKVRLRGNSIPCDCQLVNTVLDNSQVNGHQIPFSLLPFNSSTDVCSDSSKDKIVNYLTNKAFSYECQSSTWEIALIVSFIFLFLFGLMSFFIYHNYKLSILFGYLTIKERLGLIKFRGRNVPMENLDGSEKDAFVSYSCEDESFVEKMVFILENEGFDLLLYKRDFNAGDIIPDRILQSIESSRKTILVLSESFAKSQWCLWEMYIAHHRTVTLMQDAGQDPYLILIKMSEIDEAIMSPTLKHLLKTRVYLEWKDSPFRQKIFWTQLKMALMPNKGETNPIDVLT